MMEFNPFPWLVKDAWLHPVTALLRADTDVSRDVFISPWFCRIVSVMESHSVASSSGTLQIEVLSPGQDADAGVDQLPTAMNLASTADTPVTVVLTEPTLITPGDRIGVVLGGTLTSLVNANITIMLEVLQRGLN